MACDLAVLYPAKRDHITLVQSRRLMPRFHPALHDLVQKRFDDLGVKIVLGVRAEVPEGGYEALNARGGGAVRLTDGREVRADYVVRPPLCPAPFRLQLCFLRAIPDALELTPSPATRPQIHALGQSPNSQLLSSSLPSAILPSSYIRVSPSLLVAPTSPPEAATVAQRIFALGDVADSGAPKAARPAVMGQAPLVARNIARVLARDTNGAASALEQDELDLETHTPGAAAIHLTLGVRESVVFRNPPSSGVDERGEPRWDGEPVIMWRDDGVEDMGIEGVWERRVPGFVTGPQSYHL